MIKNPRKPYKRDRDQRMMNLINENKKLKYQVDCNKDLLKSKDMQILGLNKMIDRYVKDVIVLRRENYKLQNGKLIGVNMNDPINPSYYRLNPEVSEIISKWKLPYAEGNILKYLVRHKFKNGKEDIYKCLWYLINILENDYGDKTLSSLKSLQVSEEGKVSGFYGASQKEEGVDSEDSNTISEQ